MPKQWKTAQASLRVLLEEDKNYVHFLETIEEELAKKLRFACRSRRGTLVDSIAFDRFVEAAAQLKYQHVFFQGKFKPIVDVIDVEDACSAGRLCDDLVEIVTDMLSVLRILYGLLFCRRDATYSALQKVFGTGKKDWDGELLEKYLKTQLLTIDELVVRPLKRFDELIHFVEELSNTFSKDRDFDAARNGCNAGSTERVNRASHLMHIVQESKRYIHLVKRDERDEKELIALQSCFCGDKANYFDDLSSNKLTLYGEVLMSHRYAWSDISKAGIKADAGLLSNLNQTSVHCFQDGTLVCSKKQKGNPQKSFTILHCLQLKRDAAFIEHVPTSVHVFESSDEARAFTLIKQDTILIFIWKDATESQRWADIIRGFLENNGSRTDVLQQTRTISRLPLRDEISQQLVEMDSIPTKFASFHDDHLPGLFWLAPQTDLCSPQWELVEIVLYFKWLLVMKVEGWNKHSILYDFDTHSPKMKIGERVRGDNEWSLVISDGLTVDTILVSTKRTRIDFWFDQVSKAVQSARTAAQREERDKGGRSVIGERRANSSQLKADLAKKKRKISGGLITNRPTLKNEEMSLTMEAVGLGGVNLGNATDKERDDLDDGSKVMNVVENSSAAPMATKPDASFIKSKEVSPIVIPGENGAFAATTSSPAVKTPKSKWLKRKAEDPDDTALMLTQSAPSTSADEPMSKIFTPSKHESKAPEVRIVLTGIEPTASIRKKIDSILGAAYEEDVEKATHILAPQRQLKRTVKMLCGISRCVHVLDVRWLDESARVGASLYERGYCLKDTEAEVKWKFSLQKTMYDYTLDQRQMLFAGHHVFITSHRSILPPVKDLVKIIECAGGTAVAKGTAGPSDVILSSESALATASVRRALTLANPQRIYSTELILSSILQQQIDFSKNQLGTTSSGSRRRK
uniref:BRCT domain-containing protein n=1 Tax=Peronospora matthiolae TaxID=2874970 RepID=A0AAV1SZN5_9STRA